MEINNLTIGGLEICSIQKGSITIKESTIYVSEFKSINLQVFNVENTNLVTSNFNQFTSIESYLYQVEFTSSEIMSSNFEAGTFENCILNDSKIVSDNFKYVQFNGLTISNCLFHTCDFNYSIFNSCVIVNCNFTDCIFDNAQSNNSDTWSENRFNNCTFENSVGIE